MSTVDLMLLGILLKKPMNAYEIKKKLEFMNIRRWIKISSPAIYRNLVNLYRRGYLEKQIVREGEMPEKAVYSVNEKGRKYFLTLMERFAEDPEIVYISFSAMLSNLNLLEPSKALQLMNSLSQSMRDQTESLRKAKESCSADMKTAIAIIDLYQEMYRLFCDWTGRYARLLSEESEKAPE